MLCLTTSVGLDGEGGATFVSLNFEEGWVNNAVRYDPFAWNVVRVSMEFAEQRYWVKINEVEAGPFPFNPKSGSVRAFRVNYSGPGSESATAWFDSIELSAGDAALLLVDFDGNTPGPLGLCEWCTLEPVMPGSELPPPYINETRPPRRYDGLAARAESVLDEWIPSPQSFEWYQYFGIRPINPGEIVELSLAILPFIGKFSAGTSIGLDGNDGAAFVSVHFEEGQVNLGASADPGAEEIAYDPANWNMVTVVADFTTQSYALVVNGTEAGPFPFYSKLRRNLWTSACAAS